VNLYTYFKLITNFFRLISVPQSILRAQPLTIQDCSSDLLFKLFITSIAFLLITIPQSILRAQPLTIQDCSSDLLFKLFITNFAFSVH
jgi:hypothetical protein